MSTYVKNDTVRPKDETRVKETKSTANLHEHQQSLRYIFITSFILVVVSSYIYPRFLNRQYKTNSNMMTSRSSRYSNFAGAISEKLQNDRFWLEGDKQHWYHVEIGEVQGSLKDPTITEEYVMSKFVQLDADEETKNFISQSVYKADQIFTQMWHNLAKAVLKRFFGYTQTDINGYLRRGSMFVLSTQQFMLLREKAGLPSNLDKPEGSLIDLGAGDGKPTEYLKPFYKDTFATEASWAMRDILEEKSINVLDINNWDGDEHSPRSFDIISCLNLLDRCEKPKSILRQIRNALKPDGVLLIALVLPFNPYVEWNSSHEPVEDLLDAPLPNDQGNGDSKFSFEKQIASIIEVVHKEGFSVDAWTRVPYLCEGDMGQSLYVLSDAVLLCSLNK